MKIKLHGVLALITFGLAAEASAQTASTSGSPELEEVTVTATRRSESLQDVPISVAVIGQQDIQNMGVRNIQDIVRLTPGLFYVPDFLGGINPSIRGITSLVGTATTGIYLDDTPIQVRHTGGSAAPVLPDVFDLDRVEVLRGPQGTLFGSGSEGGTIRYITPDASLTDYSGNGRSDVAVNPEGALSYQFGVAGGGPIIDDTLGFRVSAYVQQDGGWINADPYYTNLTPSPVTPGNESSRNTNSNTTIALSAKLSWHPVDNLTVTPSMFYQQLYSANLDQYWEINPGINLFNPGPGGYGVGFSNGAQYPSQEWQRYYMPSLKADWNIGGVDIISITSYFDSSTDSTSDYTADTSFSFLGSLGSRTNPAASLSPAYLTSTQRQFTQELRAQSSDPTDRLTWVAGVFYQTVNQATTQYTVDPELNVTTEAGLGESVEQLFGSPLLQGGIPFFYDQTSFDKQIAAFGQVDFKLTKELSVIVGARFGRVDESFTQTTGGPEEGGPGGYSGGSSQNVTTPKYGLSYKPTDDLKFYATASKGFRPGGGNPPLPDTALCREYLEELGLSSVPRQYNSDYTWSYELGSKGELFDRRLAWDASVFYIDWQGIQNSVPGTNCGGGGFTANLGEAVSKGFDLTVKALVAQGLTLGAEVGYTDARYAKSVFNPGQTKPIISDGEMLNTPPWQVVLSADYTIPLGASKAAYLHLDDTYQGSYTPADSNDATYNPLVPGTNEHENIATVRLGLRVYRWDVSAYSTNLFNSQASFAHVTDTGIGDMYLNDVVPPRLVGVAANYKF